MFKNYLKITFRNLVRDKFYSLLNIVGLSVGLAAALLIILYIADELSYDRFFKDTERIYRVATKGKFGDQNVLNLAVSSAPLARRMQENIPEVESTTRMIHNDLVINHGGEVFKEEKVFFADSTFFDVFSFKMLEGDREKALTEKNSMVMTRKIAVKYFGEKALREGKIVGKLINTGDITYMVTGIMEDVPVNSHFDFDILLSMSTNPDALNQIWISMNYFTYVKFKPGADLSTMPAKFRSMVLKYVVPQVVAYLHYPATEFTPETMDEQFKYYLQPLADIHLKSNLYAEMQPNGNMQYLYIFGAVALFIILIACINFMNLATARSARRAKEVGICKTLGSTNKHLALRFMSESMIFIVIAVILAMGLTEAFRLPFNNISGKHLSMNFFQHPWILLVVVILTLFTGFLSGSYPAFYMTKFKPVEVLKSSMNKGKKSETFRSVLVILQFVISIGLIVCTLLVFKQMRFIQTRNLGFDKENVIILQNGENLGAQAAPFKNELLKQKEIIAASFTTHLPSQLYWSSAFKAEGENEQDHIVFYCFADYDYPEVIGLKMIQGRFFSKEFPSDSSAIVINEAAAHLFGWDKDHGAAAIGKNLETIIGPGQRISMKIVGVVKDYNFQSLRNEIRPMAIRLGSVATNLAIRIAPGNPMATLDKIRTLWKSKITWLPFEYSFLDQDYEKLFASENTMASIITIFAGLAIVIACLGLFGLAAYTSEQRTKEIGIRKALGASSVDIVNMLNTEFTKLVIIAFVIAVPVAWYFMNNWLKAFAYKTHMGIWPFVFAGTVALLIAWITVSYNSIRAAISNPVNSLRNE